MTENRGNLTTQIQDSNSVFFYFRKPPQLGSKQCCGGSYQVPFLFMLFIHLSSSSISISITEGVSSSKIGLDIGGKKDVLNKAFHSDRCII